MSLIFDIKRYAINDGPGIRITLFMKGCPLSCVWCHNPEGIRNGKDKLYTAKKCLGCGTCLKVCPNGALTLAPEGIITDKQKCVLCGRCAEECPAMAIEISGTEYTAEYLMHEIEKEIPFMDQSGCPRLKVFCRRKSKRPQKRPLLKTAQRQFPQFCSELTLGELFTTTCLAKTDFLTFDFTSVTCNKTCLRQNRLESCIVIDQSASNTVTDCAGLTGFTTAANIDIDVECLEVVGEDERLTNDHAAGFAVDVLIKRTAVDFDLAGAALHEDASNGALAAASAVVVISNHFLDLKLFGLLGGVFMVAAGINEELLEHGIAKRALRKHAFNCEFNNCFRFLF